MAGFARVLIALLVFCFVVTTCLAKTDKDHEEHEHEHLAPRNETNPVDEVLAHYDANGDSKLDRDEFKTFYKALFSGEGHAHAHEDEKGHKHDHDEHSHKDEDDHEDHNHDDHDHEDEDDHEDHDHDEHDEHDEHGEHDHDEDEHSHKRQRRGIPAVARRLLSIEDSHEDEQEEEEQEILCPSAGKLFKQFDRNQDNRLNRDEIRRVIPVMLMMVLDGCEEEHEDSRETCEKPSTAESWGFGILSSFIITIISVVGIVLIPLEIKKLKKYIIAALVSFAIGALVGDAILHLLPEAFGVHGHDHEEEAHAHGEEGAEEEEDDGHDEVLYKGMVALATILGCLAFEKLLIHILPGGHGHSHGGLDDDSSDEEEDTEKGKRKHSHHNHERKGWRKIKSFGYLNLISDAIHNFVDGLIMGFNWSVDLESGFKSTLAIGFHEIPQEFGDFGLLCKAGFTKWQAIGFNLLTAAFSILGTVIGLGVGSSVEDATPWINAVTAGFFLYIGLADMLPLVMHLHGKLHGILQFFSISLGFVIMFLLGKYAEFESDCVRE